LALLRKDFVTVVHFANYCLVAVFVKYSFAAFVVDLLEQIDFALRCSAFPCEEQILHVWKIQLQGFASLPMMQHVQRQEDVVKRAIFQSPAF
jgi:hypothetical protein